MSERRFRPFRALESLPVRARLPIFLLVLSVLILALAVAWTRETQHQLTHLNAQERTTKKELMEQIIQLKSQQLAGLTYDYGYWDDLRTFLDTGDKTWAKNNLISVLKGQNTDGLWIYRRDQRCVLTSFRRPENTLKIHEVDVFSLRPAAKAHRWYQVEGSTVWELYGTTIHRGEDAEHKGAYFGYIVIGRLLDRSYLSSLETLSQCRLSLLMGAQTELLPTSQHFDTSLKDNNNVPVATLRARMLDSLGPVIEDSVVQAEAYFVGIAILVAVLVGVALIRWIGRPIGLLADALKRRDAATLGPLLHQKNEFGDLARLVLDFFVQEQVLVQARNELEERVAERTEALAHQAYHDALTGLPNRTLFRERLDSALALAQQSDRGLAVVFMDMDNFKVINDSLGHEVGDLVLRLAAERMLLALRANDLVARLSGDEFALLLPGVREPEQVQLVTTRLQEAFQAPLPLQNKRLVVTLSMGSALFTGQESATDLIRNADTAMYVAKSQGKGGMALFDSQMKQQADRRLELEIELRHALADDPAQLTIAFQPIFSLTEGRIQGVEALARWNHPTLGAISPAQFIPVAEEAGLIGAVGAFVLEEAGRQVVAWSRQLGRPLQLSINLSVRQLQEEDIVERIQATLQRLGIVAGQLELEVTESVMMQHPELVVDRLSRLRKSGIRIAADDFGTGYSSMAVLAQLPLDVIKVDRSFVSGLEEHSEATAIIQAILELAHALNLTTTAEGIETQLQWDSLQELGCTNGQGYFFCRPLSAEAIGSFLLEKEAALPPQLKAA
ncbi:putative bifunctional diguanylate cyclase/phosphodiesterase [Armatimonas rosea]|uniref:Diguanylate cyclase (GGDEF)-like protein n=1 Tax=Armatimonas rosea TaxID=685828 RepID=A0A7W9W849_ARMRO|nr:EAL domain-containing protein [Armatimonas rosea]MBB6051901.1 diguanylate cyclase (GGDEF)-like protein [Armatimonas rosea]